MRFFDYIRVAFKNLARQRARTILTVIAIVIGSMSVIIMLSLVISAKRVMLEQLESIGALSIVSVNGNPNNVQSDSLFNNGNNEPESSDTKKLDDTVVESFKKMDHAASVTPTMNVNAKSMMLESQSKKTWANVTAYDISSKVFETPVAFGRELREGDMDKIVVGVDVLKTFGLNGHPQDAVGKNMIFIFDYMTPDWGGVLPAKPI